MGTAPRETFLPACKLAAVLPGFRHFNTHKLELGVEKKEYLPLNKYKYVFERIWLSGLIFFELTKILYSLGWSEKKYIFRILAKFHQELYFELELRHTKWRPRRCSRRGATSLQTGAIFEKIEVYRHIARLKCSESWCHSLAWKYIYIDKRWNLSFYVYLTHRSQNPKPLLGFIPSTAALKSCKFVIFSFFR